MWRCIAWRGPARTSDLYRPVGPYAAAAGSLWLFKHLAHLNDIMLLVAMAALSYLCFWSVILLTPGGRETFAELASILGARFAPRPSQTDH